MKNFIFLSAICVLLNTTASFAQAGSLDSSFGKNGALRTKIGYSAAGFSVAIQPDGKILVAGTASFATGDFVLVRYTSAGNLNAGFGSNGIAATDFGQEDQGLSVVIKPDGKILVAGITTGSGTDFALAQYTPNGQPDGRFGSGGKVITDIGSGEDYGCSIALQADGKILLAGSW